MASLTEEEIQELQSAASITIEEPNILESSQNGLPRVEATINLEEEDNILESSQNGLPKVEATINLEVVAVRNSTPVKGVFGDMIVTVIRTPYRVKRLFVRVMECLPVDWIIAGVRGSAHGRMPTESIQETGDPEEGNSLSSDSQGGSDGSMLPDDPTNINSAVKYLKRPETYTIGLLIYGLNSSFGTLKEGFPKPTPAKKALWYLLFGNVGTIFVLFTMLARAPRGSNKARFLVKSMTAAGVLMFGLNLTLIYLKYKP